MTPRLPLMLLLALSACPGRSDDSDSDGATGGTTSGTTGTTTVGELPPASEVCPAACAKFASCADDPASFDEADCIQSCAAGIEFLATNNPGTACGHYELGRQDCLSKATCEQLDLYPTSDPNKPCQEWNDLLSQCAIE